jgi:hypothetical protein
MATCLNEGGLAVKELFDVMSQPPESNVLLLQPQSCSDAVVAQLTFRESPRDIEACLLA